MQRKINQGTDKSYKKIGICPDISEATQAEL